MDIVNGFSARHGGIDSPISHSPVPAVSVSVLSALKKQDVSGLLWHPVCAGDSNIYHVRVPSRLTQTDERQQDAKVETAVGDKQIEIKQGCHLRCSVSKPRRWSLIRRVLKNLRKRPTRGRCSSEGAVIKWKLLLLPPVARRYTAVGKVNWRVLHQIKK